MKIAFIGQKGIPATTGGVERRVDELSVRMVRMGHAVSVYVRDNYTEKSLREYKGVRLIHLPSIPTKHLDAISHTFLATMHALFQDYTIVHYQAPGPSSLSWIIRVFKKKSALVATFNSRDDLHQKWGPAGRLYLRLGEYVICKAPKKTAVLTTILKQYVAEKYGTQTVVIPNGCAIQYNADTSLLRQWGLHEKRYMLCVSRLIHHKGIHYLIDAFKQLDAAGALPGNFKLVIVGFGFHTDDYVDLLTRMSAGKANIVFTGTQTGAALEQLFSHPYLFVQPSEAEGLSNALLEALGCGIAPLVSDIPENVEPLQGLGFYFRCRDTGDLRDQLHRLIHAPDLVSSMGTKVKALADTEYNWDAAAEKYIRLYEEALR